MYRLINILSLIAISIIGQPILADNQFCKEIFQQAKSLSEESQARTQDYIWSELRKMDLLVNQDSIDGRYNLCGAACVINILQGVALVSNQEPFQNPQERFEQFVEANVKAEGGMGTAKVLNAIKDFAHKIIKIGLKISAIQVGKDVSSHRNVVKPVNKFDLDYLMVRKGRLKMQLIAQFNDTNEIDEYHFQIIEEFDGKTIKLVDPYIPQIDLSAKIEGTYQYSGVTVPRFYYIKNDDIIISGFGFIPIAIISIDVSKRRSSRIP